jgi:hypothetical protein
MRKRFLSGQEEDKEQKPTDLKDIKLDMKLL